MRTFKELKLIADNYIANTNEIIQNPFVLMNKLGIEVKFKFQLEKEGNTNLVKRFEKTCAMIETDGDKVIIYVDQNAEYQRFYAFHEIAHYLLKHDKQNDVNEIEANRLACLLIAPPSLLPTYLKNSSDLACLAKIPLCYSDEYWSFLVALDNKRGGLGNYTLGEFLNMPLKDIFTNI